MYRIFLLTILVVVALAQGPDGEKGSGEKGPGGKGPGGKGPGGKGGPRGPGGRGGPIVHELTKAVICGQTEMMTCFQPMSNFAEIQAAIGKVEISDAYKKTACPTEEERKLFHETNKKIHESIKPILKKEKKDNEEMKTVGECMRKLRKDKKDAGKVTPAE